MDIKTSRDGLKLHLQQWPATAPGPAKGTVQIVHGLGEHIGRYEAVAARLNAMGWNVAGHDLRGHGRSEGGRGVLGFPDAMLADVGTVADALRADAAPGRPMLLFGHSLGGLIAARYVAEGLKPERAPWWRAFDGLVLSSPALDAGMPALQRETLRWMGPLSPDKEFPNGLHPSWISRDKAVVKAYTDDPLVHSIITPRLARWIVTTGEFTCEQAKRWTLPTLLLWAGEDLCVAATGSATFLGAAPPGVVEGQGYPGLYHEIFNEPEREQVYDRLATWLHRYEKAAA